MYLWGQRSPSSLGNVGFRPNQAVRRGNYGVQRVMQGLADDVSVLVDPTILIAGVGVLALAGILFAGRKAAGSVRTYRRKRIQRKRKKLQQQLFSLGSS